MVRSDAHLPQGNMDSTVYTPVYEMVATDVKPGDMVRLHGGWTVIDLIIKEEKTLVFHHGEKTTPFGTDQLVSLRMADEVL